MNTDYGRDDGPNTDTHLSGYRDPARTFHTPTTEELSPFGHGEQLAQELEARGHLHLAKLVRKHHQVGWTPEEARAALDEWRRAHGRS